MKSQCPGRVWTTAWLPPKGWRGGVAAVILSAMIVGVGVLVYATGGIKYVYAHAMYIPLVLAGMLFRVPGGVLAGIAGGLILGPLMPIDTVTGEAQKTANWVWRLTSFTCIGTLSGLAFGALVRQLERIRWMAFHNTQTDLPNERDLLARMNDWLLHGKCTFHLIIVSADNLLDITNTLGHETAAPLLSQLHNRLAERLPDSAQLFHYHPERLAIMLPTAEVAGIETQLNLVAEVAQRGCSVGDVPLHVSTSVGCVRCGGDGLPSEHLLAHAHIAMKHARDHGRRHVIYSPRIDQTSRDNLALLGSLVDALEEQQFVYYYQPLIDLRTGHSVGAEALVRWEHPSRGVVPPGDFLPQAESTGLVHALTDWGIGAATERLADWKAQGLTPRVAINISVRDLERRGFIEHFTHALESQGVAPTFIEIEVTESDVMRNPASAVGLLTQFQALGITVSVDDFGTGHSSLAYLHRLPVTNVKIDRSFTMSLLEDRGAREIVRGTIELAHNLDLNTIAEGIEDEDTLRLLRDWGCDYAQGYLFARPMPHKEAADWFRTSDWRLAGLADVA